MANPRWIGDALDVTQKDTITVANTWAAADTASVTIGAKTVVVTVGATVTTAAVATAIKEAINGDTITGDATRSADGSDIPEFAEVVATISGSVVTVTGREAGRPFTMTVTESTAGTGTATRASLVACTGKNWWDNAKNWDTGSVPADADVVYIDNSSVSILYGLDQSAVEPAAVYISASFTGTIGLPEQNEGGYYEYRSKYLQLGPAILQIGAGVGNGSGRIKIDSTADQCALTVISTGSPQDVGLPAVIWKGTHASNALVQSGGSVGVAVFGGEAATLATVTKSGGELTTGSGVTLSGALVQNGGAWVINSKIDGTYTQGGGAALIQGTADVDQLTLNGGRCVLNTTGTLGGATVISGDGVLDLSGTPIALAGVSAAIDLYGTASAVIDPFKRLGNAAFDLNQGATVAQLNLGTNARVTRGAVA